MYNFKEKLALAKMSTLFSSKTGIINSFGISHCTIKNISILQSKEKVILGNSPQFYLSNAQSMLENKKNTLANGAARSLSKNRALIKAGGECIERYSATMTQYESLAFVYNSFESLCAAGYDCIDPETMLFYSQEQYESKGFPFSKPRKDDLIYWITGKKLPENEEVYIPAQKVFLQYKVNNPEPHYTLGLSTGLACGSSLYSAIRSGMYETIERDSFMLTWLFCLPGEKILLDNIENDELRMLWNTITIQLTNEDKIHIYNISQTKDVYTFMGIIINNLEEASGVVVAAATDLDPQNALIKLIEELIATYNLGYDLKLDDVGNDYKNMLPEQVMTLHDHVGYYTNTKNNQNLHFMLSSNKYVKLSDLKSFSTQNDKEDVDFLVNSLRRQGFVSYFCDITKPEIKDVGLHVIKAIIPEFVDLDVVSTARNIHNLRILEYKKIHGETLNTNPHPFP